MLISLVAELQNVALGVDGDPLHRWYDQVVKRVWSSFTCAGHITKKATFIVVYNKDLWEHSISSYNLPGDVLVCQTGFFTVQTWIESKSDDGTFRCAYL